MRQVFRLVSGLRQVESATLITLGIAGCALYVGIKQTEIANRQTEIAAQR